MNNAQQPTPNPIIATTALRCFPGWQINEFLDGTFDARQINGVAMSPVETSFADALYFVKHGTPVGR